MFSRLINIAKRLCVRPFSICISCHIKALLIYYHNLIIYEWKTAKKKEVDSTFGCVVVSLGGALKSPLFLLLILCKIGKRKRDNVRGESSRINYSLCVSTVVLIVMEHSLSTKRQLEVSFRPFFNEIPKCKRDKIAKLFFDRHSAAQIKKVSVEQNQPYVVSKWNVEKGSPAKNTLINSLSCWNVYFGLFWIGKWKRQRWCSMNEKVNEWVFLLRFWMVDVGKFVSHETLDRQEVCSQVWN